MAQADAADAQIAVRSAARPSSDYQIHIGAGLLPRCTEIILRACPAERYALITDDTVEPLYAARVRDALGTAGLRVDVFSFRAGEEHKTRETWARLSDAVLGAGFGRDGAVIALGGGVVGDLAGFVAATFMRGIPVVQVPTTLLAMVDASVGGKTGVDTPAGKNLIGAFHPPAAVLADTETLETLPIEHLRAGLAEAVKHGAIADADYLGWITDAAGRLLSKDVRALTQLVERSVRIKADFVARDEREAGPRQALNFGHTIGHAVEAGSGYRVLHGEAVAIGMVAEARIGEEIGVTAPGTAEHIRTVLEGLGLPVAAPQGLQADEIVEHTRTDKKARGGSVRYALVERVGTAAAGPDGRWSCPVEDDLVRRVLNGAGTGRA